MATEEKGGGVVAAADEGPRISEQEMVERYRMMLSQCQQLRKKVSEVEEDAKQHDMVLGSIKTMDPGRKAFRMVGGILMEKTIGEIVPAVGENMANLNNAKEILTNQLKKQEVEAAKWKIKYNIKSQSEMQEQEKQANAARMQQQRS